MTNDGEVAGLQTIDRAGEKWFLRWTPKKGRYHPIGRPDGRVILAEGYATAATLHEATGIATAVAFDAYNLAPVAKALREKFPDSEILVAADNDRSNRENTGVKRATAAAEAVGGRVAIPDFRPGEEGDDWNDFALSRGLSAVAEVVESYFMPRAKPAGEVRTDVVVQFAVEGLATACEPVLIVSDDGAGKTTLLLSILAAMAAGERVFDRFAVIGGPVLIVSEEDPEAVLVNHAEAIARGHGWSIDAIHQRLHVLALKGVQLEQDYWRRGVLAEVRRIGAVAVGLDPYADLTNAKENDNDETRPFP